MRKASAPPRMHRRRGRSAVTFHVEILLEIAAVSRQGENVPRRGEFHLSLNSNEEGFVGIALCAFKGAQIETRFGRLDAGQPHRFAASGAVQNSDLRNAQTGLGLSGQHDAPLGPGGSATLSVTDRCQWRSGDRTSIFLWFHTSWSVLLIFKNYDSSRP